MSVVSRQSSLLTLRPSITETRNSIIISTGSTTKLLSLFSAQQTVEIVPKARKISIKSRELYFLRNETQLQFDDIWYIKTSFRSIGTDYGMTSEGYDVTDRVESYSISLVTKREDECFICAFRGEGAVCTGWTGVLLGGDSLIDYEGTQRQEAGQFTEYLSEIIGAPTLKPLEGTGDMAQCPKCGKPTAMYMHKGKCLNCGSQVW